MKKKTARLTLLQEATERTSQGEKQNKTRKTHSGMNESASLTPVQGLVILTQMKVINPT